MVLAPNTLAPIKSNASACKTCLANNLSASVGSLSISARSCLVLLISGLIRIFCILIELAGPSAAISKLSLSLNLDIRDCTILFFFSATASLISFSSSVRLRFKSPNSLVLFSILVIKACS